MATCNSIPAHTADKIAERLNNVAIILRAMRDMAFNAESEDDYEILAPAIEGLAERSHLIIDACLRKMGSMGLGNYDDNQWDDEGSEEHAAEGGAA